MTADVIIVSWRSGARILGCLSRLSTQHPPGRTIVVDNASGDGTVEGVRAAFPEVRILALDTNRGFGAAVNAGVAASDGEALVLINDDVEVEEGFMAAILSPLEDQQCGMVAGMTMIPGEELVDGFGIELDVTLAAYNRLRRRSPNEQPGRLAMPSGGAAAYRRVAFEGVGGFDERLFAYGEDVDLGLRMLREGWTAAEAPRARGVHEGGASFGVDSPRQRELSGFARGFLLRRYGLLGGKNVVRTLTFEALVIGWGVVHTHTLIPLRSRLRGWRAARGERLAVPPAAIDRTIGPWEALRRLRQAR